MLVVRGGARAVALAALSVLVTNRGSTVGEDFSPADEVRPFEMRFGARDSGIIAVDAAAIRRLAGHGSPFVINAFPLGTDKSVDLEVERFRITAPGTRFVVGRTEVNDLPIAFDPERVLLLRGRVAGRPGSHVFLALSQWGSMGRIELGGGGQRYLMSSVAAGEGAGDQMRLAVTDRAAYGGGPLPGVPLCGTAIWESTQPPRFASNAAVVLPEVTQLIDLAIETDYEFFQLFGDLDAAGAYVVELFGAVSDIYQRDVNTRIKLSFVRLWDDPNDLFNEESPIVPFRTYWEANMAFVPRDVAQFVSGRRNMPYGGAAYLSTLCSNFGYGVCGYIRGFIPEPIVPGIDQYDIQVTAHELGHNCGTLHTHDYLIDTCDDVNGSPQRSTIMSYCSQTRSGGQANTDLRFHTSVQSVMKDHIFSVLCVVDDCNGNGVSDAQDIANGDSMDFNGNGIADECEDCNGNGVLDSFDILLGVSLDLNANGVPDECEPDCNGNNVPDDLDIQVGNDTDLYGNNIPDGCEVDCNSNGTSDYTEIQADMSLDIDRNAVLDSCQDCDGQSPSDFEVLAGANNVWVASQVAGSGLSEFHATAGVLVKTSVAGVLNAPQDLIITATGRILVSSANDDRVVEFNADGAYVGDFVTAGSGGLNFPTGMVIAPNGNLLVSSGVTHSVLEYDGAGGIFLGAFVAPGSGGLVSPFGLAFGPNGNLFVTSGDGRVIEYGGGSGAAIGDFVTILDNGGLLGAHGIVFKPDGNLLVASFLTDQILEYDGASGAFLGQFNKGGTETVLTLDRPWTLRIGRDGNVYASRHLLGPGGGGNGHDHDDIDDLHINSTRIYIFEADGGLFLRSYVTGNDTGLFLTTGFDFMPGDWIDCNFNQLPDSCDIASGFSTDNNANGIPDECDGIPGDVNGDGAVNVPDLLNLLASWGPCPSPPPVCAGDFDGDGVIGVPDLLILLANWG